MNQTLIRNEQAALLEETFGDKLKQNEPLAKHTSFRIGGPADYFLRLQTEDQALTALKLCHRHAIPLLILGNGTNILILDKGWRGLVLENRLDQLDLTELAGGDQVLLKVGSGAVLGGVARKVAKAGWAGFEFASTIPGSVGGGVVNNAGAHGGDFSQVMTRVAVATSIGDLKILVPSEMALAYRNSRWREKVGMAKAAPGQPGNELILWAEFLLKRGDPGAIKAHIDEMTDWRRAKQPQEPNAGSIFKNPPAPHPAAGYLIEKAGLKGHMIGNAQISPKHANFIVNNGGATAQNVLDLIGLVRQTVLADSGVALELEIELLGEG